MRKVPEDRFVSGTLIEGSEPCVLLLLHGKMLFWPASAKGNPLGGLYIPNNMPFNAPFSGLASQWLVSSIVMICAPPGDAYLFMLNRT